MEEEAVLREEEGVSPHPMVSVEEDDLPTPFLKKTYEMVDDPSTDLIVSWSGTNNSFIIRDLQKLSDFLLPSYFKHNNFTSFTRQLNTYGFKKVQSERWEFANEYFLKGRKDMMKKIKRRTHNINSVKSKKKLEEEEEEEEEQKKQHRKQGSSSRYQEVHIQQHVLEQLERHRGFNMTEICNLKHRLRSMDERLRHIERKQQNMALLITRAIQNPTFCYTIGSRFKF